MENNNAAAITDTIPPNSSVAYAVGDELYVLQLGAGQVTVSPGTGVTLNSAGASGLAKTRAQFSIIGFVQTATNTWNAFGDLA